MKNTFPRWLAVVLSFGMLVLLIGTAWFYRTQKQHLRQESVKQLQSIAKLKGDQIAAWRADQLAKATVLRDSHFLVAGVARWMVDPRGGGDDYLRHRLRSMQEQYGYRDVLLVDANGRVRLSLAARSEPVHADVVNALAIARRDRKAVIADLHEGPKDTPHLDVIAPLSSPIKGNPEYVGAVILQIDARQFLYPLVQSWPVPSRTAETLLVRRDGDTVLFLNDLRYRKDAALRMRIPLSQTNVPAVMAVAGKEGVVAGEDYRGIKVLSILKAIPDSPWFMVTKMDEAEAFEKSRFFSVLILALALGLVAAGAAAVGVVWQRNAKAQYLALFRAEESRRKSEESHRITLMSVGDGVIATDAQGRVELLNPVCETLTGWSQDEARGRPLEEVFRIVNEKTRKDVENPVRRVMREGLVVGLANHTLLIARDGTEHAIADSGAPIRNDRNEIIGVVLVFRDQSEERAAERALRESEERYRGLFQNMREGCAFCKMIFENGDPVDFIYLSANAAFETLTGLKDVVGKRVSEVIPGIRATDPSLFETYARVASTGIQEYTEIFVEALQQWFSISVYSPERGYFVAVFDVVTDRKRDEIALRRSEGLFKVITSGMPDHIFVQDGDLRYSFVMNPPLGLTEKDMLGMTDYDFLSKEEADKLTKVKRRVLESGESFHWETSLISRAGEQEYFAGTYVPKVNAQRQVDGLIGYFRNITKRKRAEKALRESETRYRSIFDYGADGIVIIDPDTAALIDFNNQACTPLGYTREEFGCLKISDIDLLEGPEEARAHIQKIMNTGYDEFETVHRTKRGERRNVHVKAQYISVGGKPLYQCIWRDITDRKLAEAEKEKLQAQLQQAMKMEAVGRLAGGVAHDFNNLLTVITGYSELLLQKIGEGSPMRGEVEEIRRAGERAALLTQQLLAFSRKQIIEPKILHLDSLVAEMHKMLTRLIGEDIALQATTGKSPGSVKVDPGQFQQILVNLVVNARDAMPDGGKVMIETANVDLDEEYCALHPYVKPGRFVMLAVSDTGKGMSEEVKANIFEPFFTTKETGSGTGLGLATTYGAVHQAGGSIEVYSEVGIGTTFKIYLPRLEEEAVKPEKYDRPTDLPGGTETVLLVEDEDLVRDLCVQILERLGYKVLRGSNGSEAIAVAKKYGERIDLLLTDVVMPGMSGADLATQLVLHHPEMKVLFTSGYTDEVITRHGVLDEGVSFIGKPYTLSALARKVREVLDKA